MCCVVLQPVAVYYNGSKEMQIDRLKSGNSNGLYKNFAALQKAKKVYISGTGNKSIAFYI